MNRWERIEGSPLPLGVSWNAEQGAFNFSLYSKHAEVVQLVLYSADDLVHPCFEFTYDYLKNKSGPVWHCRVARSNITDARYYAYRIDGPAPGAGYHYHHFDYSKVLLDPYARTVFFPKGFRRDAACGPGSNAGRAPLGVLSACECPFDWEQDLRPRHDHDLVIYELHVRGFTQRDNSGVPLAKRGTFLGIVEKIPYLLELGITALELMPVFQFDPDAGDYWGYMPLNFFSPHHRYGTDPESGNQQAEFRTMVKELHRVGIEVVLDVVYNHTCEGDHTGPIYSFKGIDSTSFYMMTGLPDRPYANYSGTGNTLHTANRSTRKMIVDSLRYWDTDAHVDGFRFDLASIFTRNSDGSINIDDPPIISEIVSGLERSNNRLIAEPWDAEGEFQLGRKFPGQRWMQWNAHYRNTLQRFVRGDSGMVGDLMTRLYGSDDLFPDDRLHAFQPMLSVNYVASHDGFTLYDLVSYSHKRNEANGQENRDGANEFSSNCGWEGDHLVPEEVEHLRRQQVKNFACLLLLSNGTPMFRMGDEFLQTQHGNNNPFNQDNETSWLDWSRLSEAGDIFRFFKLMIAFRKSHPSISRSRFWRDDVKWYGANHAVDLSESSQQLAYCLHGASQNDVDLYVMINAGVQTTTFGIHEGAIGDWKRVIDTAKASPGDFSEVGENVNAVSYQVSPCSVVVLRSRDVCSLPLQLPSLHSD
ncbi:glycogen debranching protein [Novipirellula artificiosorum]|uniref:Glycogen debranching enzyme n=1 Tax=Novipirellula artificiosorum TaxID=2528016 RepID=A0A5C6DNX4_9BACT|nr:isoamylase [Novipirellula artificiosorum]TWU38500.1 Glycogen debranching enzyme [Novipirellula artificiosorum]